MSSSIFSKQCEPVLFTNYNRVRHLEKTLPALEDMNLNQTLNTMQACRVCRGMRIIAVHSRARNEINYSNCLSCKGTGVFNNGDGL